MFPAWFGVGIFLHFIEVLHPSRFNNLSITRGASASSLLYFVPERMLLLLSSPEKYVLCFCCGPKRLLSGTQSLHKVIVARGAIVEGFTGWEKFIAQFYLEDAVFIANVKGAREGIPGNRFGDVVAPSKSVFHVTFK
jgi:hypothetical protein